MVVSIVEVLGQDSEVQSTSTSGVAIEVLQKTTSPLSTISGLAVAEVVAPGGAVANVSWGYDFPDNPVEGQIFIKVTP